MTSAICKMTRNVSRTWSTENSSKDSAQSPPKSTKPSPMHARPSSSWSVRTSPAKTSGAQPASSFSAAASFAASGYVGICFASKFRQELGLQGDVVDAPGGCAMDMRSGAGPRRAHAAPTVAAKTARRAMAFFFAVDAAARAARGSGCRALGRTRRVASTNRWMSRRNAV